ncbi:DNA alkylation repair protein [Primorskyibacter sp. S187A]|uniref:DNA alkylation repair protein n=1 Tax=Primorskyibacter sp. S187A TaxID=3415130 RepID=UPI003C7B47A3
MTFGATEALAALDPHVIPGKAEEMAAYHKVNRPYLGVANPVLDEKAREWRRSLSVEARVSLARDLWATNIHEARILAAKLLTQARLRPDAEAWALICDWVPSFDAWAVADHACMAGQRRLTADPSRLDEVALWTTSEHMWTKRAALVITLPWAKLRNPKPHESAAQDRILGWAAGYLDDKAWFIQKAVAWWVRYMSKHDPEKAAAFIDTHGARMKPFARKEAGRLLNSRTPEPPADP